MNAFAPRMKHVARLAVLSALLAGPALAQDQEPSDAQLGDWLVYMKSVGMPATIELCAPVLKDTGQLQQAGARWTEANRDRIERGRIVGASKPPQGTTVEQYNTTMIEKFRTAFAAKPEDFKLNWCKQYAASLQVSPAAAK